VDFRIVKENIDYKIFQAEELKERDWNPLVYNQSLANSLYLLVAATLHRPKTYSKLAPASGGNSAR